MDEKYPLALPKGTVLAGQYIIEEVLGQGGFGITYRASEYKTDKKYAVKEFFPDVLATRTGTTVVPHSGQRSESFRYGLECFLDEAKTLAKFIGNENIVKIHTYFEENDTAYFVMDFVEGISFDAYIKEHGGKVDYDTAERILLPVIEALFLVHEKGIVHRDVTPDNIYITNDGTVKLLDFGAARYSLGDKSRSLDVILKHGFAPKEQYARHGRQGPYTDVYAVGASFYFALTGKRPPDSIDRLEDDELILPSILGVDIPSKKEDAILKALEVQPADRYQTMAEFKNALISAENPVVSVNTDNNVNVYGVQPMQAGQPVQYDVATQEQYNVAMQSQHNVQPPQVKKKKTVPVIVVLIITFVVAGTLVAASVLGGKDKKKNEDTTSGIVVNQSTDTEAAENLSSENTDTEEGTSTEADNNTGDGTFKEIQAYTLEKYDVGSFNTIKVNNASNGGRTMLAGNDYCFVRNEKELCYYDISSDTETVLDNADDFISHIYEVIDENNDIRGIRYIKDGAVYEANKDGSGITKIYDDNYVVGLFDNGKGAFVLYASSKDADEYKLAYCNWKAREFVVGDSIYVRSCKDVTIVGDRIYYLTTAKGSTSNFRSLYSQPISKFGNRNNESLVYEFKELKDVSMIIGDTGHVYFLGSKKVTSDAGDEIISDCFGRVDIDVLSPEVKHDFILPDYYSAYAINICRDDFFLSVHLPDDNSCKLWQYDLTSFDDLGNSTSQTAAKHENCVSMDNVCVVPANGSLAGRYGESYAGRDILLFEVKDTENSTCVSYVTNIIPLNRE